MNVVLFAFFRRIHETTLIFVGAKETASVIWVFMKQHSKCLCNLQNSTCLHFSSILVFFSNRLYQKQKTSLLFVFVD